MPSTSLRTLGLTLALVASTITAVAQATPNTNPDEVELEHYTLTMDAVTRLLQTGSSLAQLAHSDPATATAISSILDSNKDGDMSTTERRINTHPALVTTLAAHGFTPHQFLVVEVTVLTAGLAALLLQPGTDPAKVAAGAHINPANITFMVDHRAELEALRKQYPIE